MGSPIYPCVADLSMEVFEEALLNSCPDFLTPAVWFCYVDDMFAILQEYVIEEFFPFLNSQNSHMQFYKEPEDKGKLAFLHLEIVLQEDGGVKTRVYRSLHTQTKIYPKPTHTD